MSLTNPERKMLLQPVSNSSATSHPLAIQGERCLVTRLVIDGCLAGCGKLDCCAGGYDQLICCAGITITRVLLEVSRHCRAQSLLHQGSRFLLIKFLLVHAGRQPGLIDTGRRRCPRW